MPTLHIINKSPFDRDTLKTCLRLASAGSGILFIEDGVYTALSGTAITVMIEQAMQQHTLFILKPDSDARGISNHIIPGVSFIDYSGFVDLTIQYDKIQTWR